MFKTKIDNGKAKTNQKEDPQLSTNPRRLVVIGLLVILVFFGGIAAWSAFLPFHGAIIAPGIVEVSHERKTVQHLEGGIVDEILVREGDMVQAGDPLIKLKRSEIDASVSVMQGQLWARTARAVRLRAEGRMAEAIAWPESLETRRDHLEVAEAMNMENEIFESRRADLIGKIALHNSQIFQLQEKITGIQEELSAHNEIMETLDEEIAAKETLLAEDYIDKIQIFELKRRLAERKGRAGRLRQDVAETRQKIEEFRLRIVNLRDTYKEEAVAELSRTQDIIFELREKLLPQLDAQSRLVVTAPVAGEVINMRVHSENSGVVRAGEPILDIVPQNAELIISARVRPDQITNVEKGQIVRVALSAFNRRTTPLMMGTVQHVSGDQIVRETSGSDQTFYLARVVVEKSELEKSNAYLSPGMPAICYIETGERTILGYLLEPILEMMDRSLREV